MDFDAVRLGTESLPPRDKAASALASSGCNIDTSVAGHRNFYNTC